MLKRIQAGISRAKFLKGPVTIRIRLPIAVPILAKIWDALLSSERIMLWAVACRAFVGFF